MKYEDMKKLFEEEAIINNVRKLIYDNPNVPFWKHLEEHRLEQIERNNSKELPKQVMNIAIWNLIHTKRDLNMYIEHGIKPTRAWKVSHVKNYFGIKGTGQRLLDNFMEIFETVKPIYLGEKQ
tara:strand:+ start:838 stop:1206 length:369 start_codon:yes stop_codon:yes gene_type:complete